MMIRNKRKLQNIPITHSADIDYKDFKRIYENLQVIHNFLTICTTLPADNPLRFRKSFRVIVK